MTQLIALHAGLGPANWAASVAELLRIMWLKAVILLITTSDVLLLATSARPVARRQAPVPSAGSHTVLPRQGQTRAKPLPRTSGRQHSSAVNLAAFNLSPGVHEDVVGIERNPPQLDVAVGEVLEGWNRTLLHSGCGPRHSRECGPLQRAMTHCVSCVWLYYWSVWLPYTLRIEAVYI